VITRIFQLYWLGLATSENVRHKVIDNYKKQMKVKALKTYVRLLSQDRFKGVEFSLIREHVPFLRDITYDQLMVACEWYKNNTPQYMYQTPNLEHVIPYLYHSLPTTSPRRVEVHHPVPNSRVLTHRRASVCKLKDNYKWDNVFGSISSSTPEHTIHDDEVDSEALHEARLNFIEILKSSYHRQIKLGELDSNGELVYSLFQSLEFCEDAAARGLPLNDWEGTKIASATRVLLVDEFFRRMLIKVRHMWKRRRGNMAGNDDKFFDTDAFKVWLLVRQALAFVRAHSLARKEFEEHFCSMIPTSEEEFGLLFWEDSDKINNSSSGGLKMICAAPNSIDDTDATSVSSVATALDHERHKLGEKVVVVKVDEESGKVTPQKKSRKGKLTETDDGISKPLKKGYGLRRIKSAPISVKSSTSKKQHGKQQSALVSNSKPPSIPTKPKIKKQASTASASSSTSANSKLIDEHFPPLEICVIQSVELPYLNTTQQFFDVFFADDAPYSFRDFQKKRGDVDIVYGKWKDCSSSVGSETEDTLDSIFPPLPPRSSAKQRKQKFSTLTKSYFGPAYAKASKMQRATQLANGKILVLENVTQLSDIPFANRFQVMERWVLEVVPEEEVSKKSQSTDNNTTLHTATCKLTVYAEVQMLKSCSWEPQIRKKASETFTEVVTDWCKSARKALKATEEQKQKRLRLSKEATNNTTITKRQVSPVLLKLDATQTPAVAKQAELFAKHKRNFDQLDQLISIGDLEWCSVEVMHSPRHNSLDKSTTFSTVLEYPSLNEYEITSSNTGEDEDDNGKSSSPSKARVIMRRKSKKLFKRLSSRVINKSSQKH